MLFMILSVQAFIVSAEIEDKQLMVQLQKMIQSRLSTL